MNSGKGYQQGGEFDELGTYGKSDDISPKTEIQLNKLQRRVSTERRIQRIRRILQRWRIGDDISPKTEIQLNKLKGRVPTE